MRIIYNYAGFKRDELFDDFSTELNYTIYGADFDDLEAEKLPIGRCKVTIIDEYDDYVSYESDIGSNIHMALDSVDYVEPKEAIRFWHQYKQTGVLGDPDEFEFENKGCLVSGVLAILEVIYIDKEARGNGIGSEALVDIIKNFRKDFNAHFVILQPYPIEMNRYYGYDKEEKVEEGVKRLLSYYKRFGFVATYGEFRDKKNTPIPHMVRPLKKPTV